MSFRSQISPFFPPPCTFSSFFSFRFSLFFRLNLHNPLTLWAHLFWPAQDSPPKSSVYTVESWPHTSRDIMCLEPAVGDKCSASDAPDTSDDDEPHFYRLSFSISLGSAAWITISSTLRTRTVAWGRSWKDFCFLCLLSFYVSYLVLYLFFIGTACIPMGGLHLPRKSHLLFVCFIATQIIVWSELVGHAAYSWGVLFHHPELYIICFLRSKMCVSSYVCGM
jgi:hypothetical protein